MKQKIIFKGLLFFITFLSFGCASYTPSLVKMDPMDPNVNKQTKGDLCVLIGEYATPEKCEKVFDTNLFEKGVVPLLISIQNNGQHSYEVKSTDISIRDGNGLAKILTPEEAATKAKRSAIGRAVGWSMIVPIISIPIAAAASVNHTSKVNKQIVQDFVMKGLHDGVIMPNKELTGFLFFELNKDRKDLSGLNFEITARNQQTGEVITITSPLPNLNFANENKSDSKGPENNR
jgi:hypothetical protein